MGTCRVCKNEEASRGPLIKYSVRHYAHADCALAKWGAGFFDRLTSFQLSQFPFHSAQRAGLLGELERRLTPTPRRATRGGR